MLAVKWTALKRVPRHCSRHKDKERHGLCNSLLKEPDPCAHPLVLWVSALFGDRFRRSPPGWAPASCSCCLAHLQCHRYVQVCWGFTLNSWLFLPETQNKCWRRVTQHVRGTFILFAGRVRAHLNALGGCFFFLFFFFLSFSVCDDVLESFYFPSRGGEDLWGGRLRRVCWRWWCHAAIAVFLLAVDSSSWILILVCSSIKFSSACRWKWWYTKAMGFQILLK